MGTLAEQMVQTQQQLGRPTRLNLLYAQAYNNLPTQLQTFLPAANQLQQNPNLIIDANKTSHTTGASNATL